MENQQQSTNQELQNIITNNLKLISSALAINKQLQKVLYDYINTESIIQENHGLLIRKLPPYFVDVNKNHAPLPADLPLYGNNTKVDIIFKTINWNPKEISLLETAILRASKIKYYDKNTGNIELSDMELLKLNLELDWNEISLQVGTRSAKECKIQWNNQSRPGINTGAWTDEELEKLNDLAIAHGYRNWPLIAQELNSGRVGWQALKAYKSLVQPALNVTKWTPEQDNLLAKAVEQLGTKSWKQIATLVPGRTSRQCSNRWTVTLAPGKKKGRWSKDEDELLLQSVKKYGRGNWSLIAQDVITRTDVQIRERYENILNPEINRGEWTEQELQKLQELVSLHGTGKWANISKDMKTRTDNQCKRAYSRISFEKKSQNSDKRSKK